MGPSLSLGLDPDFAEFVECLARRDVHYLIVGGYALAAHGLPVRPEISTSG